MWESPFVVTHKIGDILITGTALNNEENFGYEEINEN